MQITQLSTDADLRAYDTYVRSHPQGSLWQSLAWKRYQQSLGRETRVYAAREGLEIVASALVIIDRTTMGLSTWDLPRGPLRRINNGQLTIDNLFSEIVSKAHEDKCLSLFFSPLEPVIFNCQFSIFNSPRHEQPEATRLIDLTQSEEQILAQMKPKGRYNIKVAEKHGITVRLSEDIPAFHRLLIGTAQRDQFGIRPLRHYEKFLTHLEKSFLLLAHDPAGNPVAGLLGVVWDTMGIYYYGASAYAQRHLMAPYLLQWEAMKLCKARGCTTYDLLGIAPPEAPADHPWSGVSDFKAKFGGSVVTYPQEQQIVLRPGLQKLLDLKRKILG